MRKELTKNFGKPLEWLLNSYPNFILLGFECDFESKGDDVSAVIEEFGKHTDEVHGIEYSKEALMQFIMRKGG